MKILHPSRFKLKSMSQRLEDKGTNSRLFFGSFFYFNFQVTKSLSPGHLACPSPRPTRLCSRSRGLNQSRTTKGVIRVRIRVNFTFFFLYLLSVDTDEELGLSGVTKSGFEMPAHKADSES